MGKKFDKDVIIIGGGAAGIAAAKNLASAGKKVAIVEARRFGGSGLHERNIPYHAAQNFSHLYAAAMAGVKFGITSTNLRYNYPTALRAQEKAIEKAAESNTKKALEEDGITCISGRAHFISQHEIAVGEKKYSASKFIIATGAVMKESGISGIDEVPHFTPSDVLKMERLPKSMIVVGGGSTGVETAEYFSQLGVKVAIAEISDRLLPREDPEVGQIMSAYFEKRLGIKILTQTRVMAAAKDTISPKVTLMRGGQERSVRVECIVLATGSKPNTDLGLENAGVNYDARGIHVEKTLQTTTKHIYAAGDVVGGDSSTEMASYEGGIAATNITSKNKALVNYTGFIRVVDTEPQVATVGMNEEDLIRRDARYGKVMLPLSTITASATTDTKLGFIKFLTSPQNKILGVEMMAPKAAMALQEVALVMRHNLSLVEIASTPHVSGEWGELVKMAAKKLL